MSKLKLQTKVKIPTPRFPIQYQKPIVLLGSCFTENIGKLLQKYKFDIQLNPCGIVYNPLSVENSLALISGEMQLQDSDIIFYNNSWYSMLHHSRFSHENKEILKRNIHTELNQAKEKIQRASHCFLTLGTSWVFEYKKIGRVISNCHKLPSREFVHYKLSLPAVVESLERSILFVQNLNPDIEIVFTVSPIRHLKDGLHENQLSKATLLLGIDELRKRYENVIYFPAYEVVMDELRDYRFFAEDMTHLSQVAVQYIWDCFLEHYFTAETQQHFSLLEKLSKALHHKVLEKESESYQKFQEQTLSLLSRLEILLPYVDFTKEKEQFSK